MDKDLKEKWLKALRSGEYKQTQRFLKKDSGFCCLGVLTDLYINENGGSWTQGITWYFPITISDGKPTTSIFASVLPYDILKNADLNMADTMDLADMNDTGSSFKEIADYIEKNL
jgi:hypothetical protein